MNPPILSDPMEYFKAAVLFPKFPEVPSHWSLRLGLVIPVSIIFNIFGYSEFTYYLFSVLSLAFLILLVFLLGEKLFNYKVGLMSALWMLFMPGIYFESGHLLPDIPATNCMLASLILLIMNNKENPSSSKKVYFLNILSGALFGWSYLTKEYFLFFFILVPIYFLISKIRIRYLFAFLAGALIVAFFEISIGFIVYRNPFIRFNAVNPREIWSEAVKDVEVIISYFPMLLRSKGNNMTFLLAIISIIGSISQIIKKNKKLLFLLGKQSAFTSSYFPLLDTNISTPDYQWNRNN
jgi:4-amino-4-deoxy-L-arabinose transferase-like glycosyltransferase